MIEFTQSSFNLYDSYAQGHNYPPDDTSLGGTFDLINAEYQTDSSGNPVVTYLRAYNTNDRYDAVVKLDSSQNFCVAWGQNTISDHRGNYKTTSFKISTPAVTTTTTGTSTSGSSSTNTTNSGGSSSTNTTNSGGSSSTNTSIGTNGSTSSNDSSDGNSQYNFWDLHGISLIAMWCVLNFFGYIAARFYRHNKCWIVFHILGSGVTSLCSIGIIGYSFTQSNIFYFMI
jgi:hypothetical protein